MTDYPRYAIYFIPCADSLLYRFGAELLGYDSYRAVDCSMPESIIDRFSDWRDLTADPRKYGFHATLKAPFPLHNASNENELRDACRTFVETPRPAPQITPVVSALGDFIAVVPDSPSAALAQLATDCVIAFEPFRAPMTPGDRARRNPDRLTERQRQQLDAWGYPYVFDDFRFHLTLTGRLPAERRPDILDALRRGFAQLATKSLAIDRIALCRQTDKASRFTVLETFALRS